MSIAGRLRSLTATELVVFGSVVEAVVVPAGAPPPQLDGAKQRFAWWLQTASVPTVVGLRSMLHVLQVGGLARYRHRFSELSLQQRQSLFEASYPAPVMAAIGGLRQAARFSFYAGDQMAERFGYPREAVLERGRELRETEGRW